MEWRLLPGPVLRRLLAILCCSLPGFLAAEPLRVATYNIGAKLSGSTFVSGIDAPGSVDHEAVRAVLGRIDADVVALQEVHEADTKGIPTHLQALADSLGYPYVFRPSFTRLDFTLQTVFMSRYPLIYGEGIGSPEGANDITRRFPAVKVDVPGTDRDPVIISAHLKSGTARSDRFRRAVEMRRLADWLAAKNLTTADNFIVMGDFNFSSTTTTFTELPTGLPTSFQLGSDIAFPISYSTNPLSYFPAPLSPLRLDPRQTNGSASTFNTTSPGGSTLDLILVSSAIGGRLHASEVYNSTLDAAGGGGLPKSGSAPAANTSGLASDHYAVFADLELDQEYPQLTASLSSPTAREGSPEGSVTLTVTLPEPSGIPTTIHLTSSDPDIAAPADSTLIIPAGQWAASTALRLPRNYQVDPARSVTISASSSSYNTAQTHLEVEDGDGTYVFESSGDTVTEDFTGFGGNHAPAPWSVTGGTVWRGSDQGQSSQPGFRSYGIAADGSLGFLAATETVTASATFVNRSPTPLTALRVSFSAEQWRAATGGGNDRIRVEIAANGTRLIIPELDFQASAGFTAGSPHTMSAVLTNLSFPPDASFTLHFIFEPGMATNLPADIFINEFHYDNAGADTGEFVEVVVGPGFAGDLQNVVLSLYNGSNGQTYGNHALSTFTAGQTTPSGHRIFWKAMTLQNDEEGLCLHHSGNVLQFIAYEGVFQATNGPVAGLFPELLPVRQSGNDPVGLAAIGLNGTGARGSDFDWRKFDGISHSPGAANHEQQFVLRSAAGLAIDDLSVTFLPDHDLDGIPDELDPDDDNDGQTDIDEWVFGSDPLDANSRFTPVIRRLPDGKMELGFSTLPLREYIVFESENLETWNMLEVFHGDGQPLSIELPAAPEAGAKRFYRVQGRVLETP